MVRMPQSEQPQAAMPGTPGVVDVDAAVAPKSQQTGSQPESEESVGFATPSPPRNRTIRVDTALAMAIGRNGEKLAMLVSHLDWLLKLEGSGVDHSGHHWVWKTHEELRGEVFMDGISLRQVKRIVDRGREIGVVVTFNPRNHQPLHYRLDYGVIRQIFESVGVEAPAWVEAAVTIGIQLDQFAEADIRAALEGSPNGAGDPSDMNVTSLAEGVESEDINVRGSSDINVTSPSDTETTSPGDMNVTSLHTVEDSQKRQTDSELASSTDKDVAEPSDNSSEIPSPQTEFIMELADRLSVSPSAREMNMLRKLEREWSAERNGQLIDPAWAIDIDRTMAENWQRIDRPVGVAVYVLRDLLEQERAGDVDMSEPPEWIPRPLTEKEMAERQAISDEGLARLQRMQEESAEREERENRERKDAEAAAEAERIEHERKEAEATVEAERAERERREAEAALEREARLQQLVSRIDRATERRSKLALHFGVRPDDAGQWESALELMFREIEPDSLLRNPGLVEVFEAMGLGLAVDGVYRVAFSSNLRQQVLLKSGSAQVVRAVLGAALQRVGVKASDIVPVIPRRIDWERHLGSEPGDSPWRTTTTPVAMIPSA